MVFNNCLPSKITTIGKWAFIFVVFLASSRMSMNLVSLNWLKKLWIIQMVWQMCIYSFLNEFHISSFIFIIWCTENPYEWMDIWATPFLKFNTFSIFYFPKGSSSVISLKNTSTFYWKCLATNNGLLFKRLRLSW